MKLKLSVSYAKTGGALHTLANDLSIVNSGVLKEPDENDETILIIDDDAAPPSQKLKMDQTQLLEILTDPNGEMSEYIMGIRVPNTYATQPVPDGLPIQKNALGEVRLIKDWFLPGSVIWQEDGGDEFIFYTNPAGGLASKSDYLTGSQIEILRQVDIVNHFILSVEEVAVIVASGWTQVDWNNL